MYRSRARDCITFLPGTRALQSKPRLFQTVAKGGGRRGGHVSSPFLPLWNEGNSPKTPPGD